MLYLFYAYDINITFERLRPNFYSISVFAEMSFSDVMIASDATLSVSCEAVSLVDSGMLDGVIVMVGDGTTSVDIGMEGEAAGFVMRN